MNERSFVFILPAMRHATIVLSVNIVHTAMHSRKCTGSSRFHIILVKHSPSSLTFTYQCNLTARLSFERSTKCSTLNHTCMALSAPIKKQSGRSLVLPAVRAATP